MNRPFLIVSALMLLALLSGCHNVCYEEYEKCTEKCDECDESYRSCCEVENCPDYSRSQRSAREKQ